MLRPLFVLLTGIVSGEMLYVVTSPFLLLVLVGAGGSLTFFVKSYKNYIFCFLTGFLVGICLFAAASGEDRYDKNAQSGVLRGTVLEIKEKEQEGKISIVIENACIKQRKRKIDLNKKVKIYASIEEQVVIYPGDTILCDGKLELPEEPTNPGEFNQKIYSRANGIYYFFYAQTYCLRKRPAHSILRVAYNVKQQFETVYREIYNEKQASLLYAMVLGDKSNLQEEDKKLYEENGVAHLLAVSGLHISIIGGYFYKFLRKRNRSYFVSCLGGISLLLFYGCMTGFGSSVTRAAIMFVIYLGSEWFGVYYDLISAMSLSGILMLFEHPYRILDGGFLISYASIFAIGMVLPIVSHSENKIKEALLSNMAIYAVTAPMIMRFYYEMTPYCILLNPIILPFMASLMICAIITGLTGILLFGIFGKIAAVYPVLRVLGYPVVFILGAYEKLFFFFRNLPASLIITGCPNLLVMMIIYSIEVIAFFLIYKKQTKKLWLILILTVAIFFMKPEEKMRITMLDIGQGDCILIQTPEGKNILIDGGSTSKKDIFKYIMKPAFSYYGIAHLDAVVISHTDEDHISGIREMLEAGFQVDVVLTSDGKFENFHQVPIKKIEKGNRFYFGKTEFTCLHPSSDLKIEDINERSVVIHMKYDRFTALFTGDLGMEQEKNIMEKAREGRLTLLKVGHHGSKNSTGMELLEAYQPQISTISSGRKNRYRHPHQELLERLKKIKTQIYQTKENGAIIIQTDGRKTSVQYLVQNSE